MTTCTLEQQCSKMDNYHSYFSSCSLILLFSLSLPLMPLPRLILSYTDTHLNTKKHILKTILPSFARPKRIALSILLYFYLFSFSFADDLCQFPETSLQSSNGLKNLLNIVKETSTQLELIHETSPSLKSSSSYTKKFIYRGFSHTPSFIFPNSNNIPFTITKPKEKLIDGNFKRSQDDISSDVQNINDNFKSITPYSKSKYENIVSETLKFDSDKMVRSIKSNLSNVNLLISRSNKYLSSQVSKMKKSFFSFFKRDSGASDTYKASFSGFSSEGIYVMVYMGSEKQEMLYVIDTTVDLLISNTYNNTAAKERREMYSFSTEVLEGFSPENSTTFNFVGSPINYTSLSGFSVNGSLAIDQISISSTGNLDGNYTFVLADQNSFSLGNIYSVTGFGDSLTENEVSLYSFVKYPELPANILGLSPPQNQYSFLKQLQALEYTTSQLFSLFIDNNSNVTLLIGAVDISRLNGTLKMQPILNYVYSFDPAKTGQSYPFITLTGFSLTNYNMNSTISFSENELSLPILLDTSSAVSYLPYSMVVYLASKVGAYYSSVLKAWIQDCSYRSVNGSIGFSFYNVTINVPVSNITIPIVNENGEKLYFDSGEQACALAFLPAEARGFSSLGTTFFESAYTVFDYINMLVGLAPIIKGENSNFPSNKVYKITNSVDEVISASTFSPTNFPRTATISPASPSFTIPVNQTVGTLSGLLTSSPSMQFSSKTTSISTAIMSSTINGILDGNVPGSGNGDSSNMLESFTATSQSTPFGSAKHLYPPIHLLCIMVVLILLFFV